MGRLAAAGAPRRPLRRRVMLTLLIVSTLSARVTGVSVYVARRKHYIKSKKFSPHGIKRSSSHQAIFVAEVSSNSRSQLCCSIHAEIKANQPNKIQ
jgi:hypothetical protein